MSEVNSLAVLVDFENLALGLKNRRDRFDIHRVLQRLVEKGKIIVKKAYSDWSRYADYKKALHEAGLELIEIPRRGMTGKNSADIHLVVDAMDLCYSKEHIDTFVIVSGDSDFSPLVAKLKENGKRVIGLAMKSATSDLLVNACDEFIFYEDLESQDTPTAAELEDVPADKAEVFRMLIDTLTALQREVPGPIYASMVKDTIRRKQPSFSESTWGYRTFSELLEDAEAAGMLELSTDARSGTYVITSFKSPAKSRRRRGGRRRSGRNSEVASSAAAEPATSEAAPKTTSRTPRRTRKAPARSSSSGTTTRKKAPARKTRRKARSASQSAAPPAGPTLGGADPAGPAAVRRRRSRRLHT